MLSNDSKAPRAVRYIRGKDIIVVAKIAEYQVMVSLNPKTSRTLEPKGPSGPIILSKKNPMTVGGKTKGSVRTPSISPLRKRGVFAM